jgi:hypothetical protein
LERTPRIALLKVSKTSMFRKVIDRTFWKGKVILGRRFLSNVY